MLIPLILYTLDSHKAIKSQNLNIRIIIPNSALRGKDKQPITAALLVKMRATNVHVVVFLIFFVPGYFPLTLQVQGARVKFGYSSLRLD